MTTHFFASPLDQFEVTKLVGIDAPILGANLTLTNLGLYTTLVLVFFLGLHILADNGHRLVPSR